MTSGTSSVARRQQHLAQVAARGLRRGRHLAFAEIGRADIDRAHVATDQVRLAREPGVEAGRRECRSRVGPTRPAAATAGGRGGIRQ